MTVKINKSTAQGTVFAPPSKSMAHRYLICAALSENSCVKGIDFSKDIEATLNCLDALGCQFKKENNTVTLGGIDFKHLNSTELFCNESGSTLRFMIPICLLFDSEITLTGTERLFSRSLSVYEKLCNEQGFEFEQQDNSLKIKGKLKSGKYTVRGDISSQFISGLMFALPLLSGDSTIEIEGNLESASYLSLTIKALADFGVRIRRTDEKTFYIKGSQSYKNKALSVEGDYSNAAFFEALNVLGSKVTVAGLSDSSVQGDMVYKEIFPLLSIACPTVDISDCPDLAPILMAVAAAKNGAVFTGTRRLKIKESDRGQAMKEELAKLGCEVYVEDNRITVQKAELTTPIVPIYGHNDHRIVMSMAVLLTLTGGEILGAQAVSKSFPDFFSRFKALGIDAEVKEDI